MKSLIGKYQFIHWLSAAAVVALTSCAGADTSGDPGEGESGDVTLGEITQDLGVLEAPICDQRLASSMYTSGTVTSHPGGTMRLQVPGSALSFWLNPPVHAGQWKFKVSARAHGDGSGYPTLRLWAGTQLVGSQQVTSWPNLQTYTFTYNHGTTGSSIPIALEYTGSSASRDLIVEGVDILCPGISCGENVCAGSTICCDGSELDEPVCTTNTCYSGGIYGFTVPRYCDSHQECGTGNLCGFMLQGNAGAGYNCAPQQNFSNPNTFPFKLCASPGWTSSCSAGQTCGAPDHLGYSYCVPQ